MKLRALFSMIIMIFLFGCGSEGTVVNPPDIAAPASEMPFAVNYGDVLDISIWGDETMNRRTLVRPDGYISYPFIEDQKVAGMTIPAIQSLLTTELSEYIPNAQVAVSLFQSNANMIYVVGRVQRPGAFPMFGPMTPIQALSLAGGITPFASPGSIHVIRTLSDGTQKSYPFNYNRIAAGNTDQNIILQPGDTVVVP